ncbi:MAG: hypothetical protein F6J90_29265 [Moorea sp. SIOASIH]|uniref:hypothetical protein n=1 Tax=Moorena sp. SIOASIH TaxID=2607817 RepID=UPI0013B79005|nr:hypothetical protein [Moorena sp. SIOASIH]NEO40214.1 hypothetical protein [Moorena sp. SIOASIH]
MDPDSNINDGLISLAHDLGIDLNHSQSPELDLDMSATNDWMQPSGFNDSSDISQPGSEPWNYHSLEHFNAWHEQGNWMHSDPTTRTDAVVSEPNHNFQSNDSYHGANTFEDVASPAIDSSFYENGFFRNSVPDYQDSSGLYSPHSTHGQTVSYSDPSSCSGEIYTTINHSGSIYKHTPDGNSYYEGYVIERTVYNASGEELGYGGRDGKIYDHFDHLMGRVDACGDVYNAAGEKVYHTTKGVVGGAVYLLDVYYGGVE